MIKALEEQRVVKCTHCGDQCDQSIKQDAHFFCCDGCKTVYQLLKDHDFSTVYSELSRKKPLEHNKYEILNNEKLADALLAFQSETHSIFSVKLPAIHCSSCIYLLENLHRLNEGVLKVEVNFPKKHAELHFNPSKLSLPDLAELLDLIGYPPDLKVEKEKRPKSDLGLKIGIAGFCFGNIMLLSFPDYLGYTHIEDPFIDQLFSYLSLVLCLPVVFYAANGYFKSAWNSFVKTQQMNIDVPIVLGILTLFGRTAYEIITATGAGYADSLAGLLFFLLLGRWFQDKTYENLTFDRDYLSYFPLAVLKKTGDTYVSTPVNELVEKDVYKIRNQEIIPADSELLSSSAQIDYSFVTGEARPVRLKSGEKIFAGGRLVGQQVGLKVMQSTSQSYLTGLWNNHIPEEKPSDHVLLVDKISKHFTLIVLSLAAVSGIFWFMTDPSQVWLVVTAVLIVACPCALALATPFSYGNALRHFGKHQLYLKSTRVVEKLAAVDSVVFDKTGTLLSSVDQEAVWTGITLKPSDQGIFAVMAGNSTHPLSRKISELWKSGTVQLQEFEEIKGAGIRARVEGIEYRLGSAAFVGRANQEEGKVWFSINEEVVGQLDFRHALREGLETMLNELKVPVYVLSGDTDTDRILLEEVMPTNTKYLFNQLPENKLIFIKQLQKEGRKVLMIGDGLNDAGALAVSDVGIAVTDDVSYFVPACDGILDGSGLKKLHNYLAYGKRMKRTVIASFGLSFVYNIAGVSVAMVGLLTPILAAVLMPLSSISVVLFTTLSGNLKAKQSGLS